MSNLFKVFDEIVRSNGVSTVSRKDENGKDRKVKIDGVCTGDTLADFAELAGKLEAAKFNAKHKNDGATLSRAGSAAAELAKAGVLSLGDKGADTAVDIFNRLKAEKERAAAERAAAEKAARDAEGNAILDGLLAKNASDPNGLPMMSYLCQLASNGNAYAAARLETERATSAERTREWAYENAHINAYARKLMDGYEAERAAAELATAAEATAPGPKSRKAK